MNFDHILHRADGTLVELNSQVGTFRAVTSEKLTAVRQDVSSAELTLVSSEAFTVNVGDWIQAKGIRLYCMSTIDKYTCSEDNNREYQLTFYSPEYYLRLAILYNTSESESGGVYSYSRVDNTYPSVGTFEDFVKLCCYNCNSVQGERMFRVGTISEDIATDIRVITFSDYNCLAVMKQSCESFETTWRVRVNEDVDPDSVFIIDFGVVIEDFPVTLKVEHSQGLTSIDVTASDKDVYTQFVIKGGSENLPSDYPYPNLQLDEDLSSTPQVLANSMIKLPDLYSRWGKSIKELTYEDIKPSRTGTVTSISENILKFTDSDLIGAAWSPVGGTIHFVSGHLIGFTFNCQDFNSATGEITIESTEESNGFILPSPTDSYYRINELDKYNIAGVSLPASYITSAKAALKERALLGIDYWSQPRMQYAITIDPKIISVEIVPNMGFHIEHSALGINKVIKVQQVVYDLSKESPYDIESILISDLKTDDSRADATHRQIATTAHRLDETDKTSSSIKKVIKNLDTYIDGAFADGLVSEAEAKAIEKYINTVNSTKADIDAQFTALYANSYLSGDPKTNLNAAKAALNTATTNLLSSINTAIADGSASEAEKADVDSKFTAFNYTISTYQTRVEQAQEAISAAMKTASENAAKNYALAQDLLLKEKTDAYADDVATAAEEAAIGAAQLKVDAAKVLMEAYADDVVSDEEARAIADANEKYAAAMSYADSLAATTDSDSTAKVTAAKNALAAKFGYANWSAMEAAVSLISGMTTSAGLINANVIDVTTLAALDAFIEELVVIKLETAVDEDGTKVRIDADAVDGRAGVLLEENTGTRGIKLYYKASSGAPILYLYSTNTGELLEFLANRMKFSKGTTKDVTIDSDSTILQLRSGTSYAQITPTSLRVDGLATAPVGKGHFWVDTEGYVHHGMEVSPTVTYSFNIQETYPTGRSDIAASGGVATFTVKLITTTDGVPDAGVLVDLDTGYPSVTSSPTGTSFSITRTGTGTYSITAASRGVVEDLGTAAAISVKYTPSGATQQSISFNILQEANSKTKTAEDTGITLSISTIYDDSDCPASGNTWTVTASGESGGREEYTYTSGASEWVSLGGTPITASLISITTSGTGLSGSGTGAGTSVTWADRGAITGERRSGTITASYSGESVSETVYQYFNAIESVTDKTINWVKLNGTNGNIEVDADSGYSLVTVELGYTNNYTSGDTYSGTTPFGHNLSVSGTGFTKFSNGRVDYTENTASSTRNGVITITYKDATPVQRTITQAAASATTYQILGEIAYSSGSQIPASGGTATLTVTKRTYINGVHQSASDVLIDCDSGYPDLVSQPTGCDVTITRTTTGTYSVSAASRGTTVNSGTEIAIDLQATISGSAKTDSVTVIQQANALASSTGYAITSVTLDGENDNIDITKSAQTITVLGSGTYTKTYTSGASESANFNLGASDISVSGTGFSYSNFTISVAANSGAERECTVTASYGGASNVTRTITQAMGIVAPTLNLDIYSLSGSTLTLKASISSAGGGTITSCGFERGNTSSLGINVSASTVQSGQFTADVTVIAGQTIYWRAYATNEAGTTYTTITQKTI